MLSRIKGRIVAVDKESVEIENSFITYRVYVSPENLKRVQVGENVELFLYCYLQGDLSRAIPVLIGFRNSVEREFFELFITVSGIGPKAAIRSFIMPVSKIAELIYAGDIKGLCSMPGIGRQRAKQIVANLQDKVTKFALLRQDASTEPAHQRQQEDQPIFDEAYQVLLQLQYKKTEAKAMVESVRKMGKKYNSVEEILADIYKIKK